MLELNILKNNNRFSKGYGKYYARVEFKQTLSIHDMAMHMAEHNTPFSVGTIEGILRDFVNCTREQCLNGNTVKIDDLAIFKCSVQANGLTLSEGMKVVAGLGSLPQTVTAESSQPAIFSAKLLAQATGEFTRSELNDDASFRWTKDAQKTIDKLINPEPETNNQEGGE